MMLWLYVLLVFPVFAEPILKLDSTRKLSWDTKENEQQSVYIYTEYYFTFLRPSFHYVARLLFDSRERSFSVW
jgi:hypothetical protein